MGMPSKVSKPPRHRKLSSAKTPAPNRGGFPMPAPGQQHDPPGHLTGQWPGPYPQQGHTGIKIQTCLTHMTESVSQ